MIQLWLPNDYRYDYWYHWAIIGGRVRDSGAGIADRVAAPKGKYNNPECSNVASRYNSQLPFSILTIGTWLGDQIVSLWGESNLRQLYSILSNKSTKADQSPTSNYGYVPIWWHMMRGCRNIKETISISIPIVVRILRIHGTTGGWTVWALSGDQWIQHLFKEHGGSIDMLYPNVGMVVIWLSDSPNRVRQESYWVSDSPNRVWQVRDSLWAYSYTWWQLRWTHCVSWRLIASAVAQVQES